MPEPESTNLTAHGALPNAALSGCEHALSGNEQTATTSDIVFTYAINSNIHLYKMTHRYQVLLPAELSDESIQTILSLWQMAAWMEMDAKTFRHQFSQSEFHLLTDTETGILQCVARINHDFTLTIAEHRHTFAELVGLVAVEQGRGSGKKLMTEIKHNLQERHVQAIGFCSKELRPFYEKCGIIILEDRARQIYEQTDAGWVPADDDDILDINLSPENSARLRTLNESNVAYYMP